MPRHHPDAATPTLLRRWIALVRQRFYPVTVRFYPVTVLTQTVESPLVRWERLLTTSGRPAAPMA